MKPRSPNLTLTLTLAFLSFHVASSLPPSPSPSPSRPPPKQTMSDPIGLHLRPPPPPPDGSVHDSCPSDRTECAKHPRHPPPMRAVAAGRTREFGRNMGLIFAGVALLMQVVFAGFLVYKRIQLREGFSALPSTTTS